MMAIFPLTRYTTHMGTSGLKLNLLVAGIATCAFWLFGYDMSVMVYFLSLAFPHDTPGLRTNTGRSHYRGVLHNCLSRDKKRQCPGHRGRLF